ncbi:MAG: hypothetical protein MUF54_19285 [Polyangiaceae bacterium]|nr:hypothetical protein [Polyangiaceae bacterium]
MLDRLDGCDRKCFDDWLDALQKSTGSTTPDRKALFLNFGNIDYLFDKGQFRYPFGEPRLP